MASSPAAQDAEEPSTVERLAEALYARCALEPAGQQYTTEGLLALDILATDEEHLLMQCTQQLVDKMLFKVSKQGDGYVFSVVKHEDAARFNSLTAEEGMIFSTIEAAGEEGIWSKSVRIRTNIHQSIVDKSLKNLQSKGLVRQIKNVKYPARKVYILASLTPSEDVTGGPWFTDGELDTEFIQQLCNILAHFIDKKSFYRPPSSSAAAAKRRKLALSSSSSTTAPTPAPSQPDAADREPARLPFPPDYAGYPTLTSITTWVNNSHATDVSLAPEHVRQLLDLLYYDKRIERVRGGKAFRSVRYPPASSSAATATTPDAVDHLIINPDPDPANRKKRARHNADGGHSETDDSEDDGPPAVNAFTETPCGKCPVFSLCEEGGPVSASACLYFKDWLQV
ncbi:MAG: 34-kDa subunit of RNA polymerase III (C) [Phylliscum demangeonii]|nr:MAG: 34-kDa subunit of RNA polymerase III (C) [Phylliscum demangeonii]